MLYCNKSTGSTGYSRYVLSKWILPASTRSAALMVLLSTGLLTATSALAVDNVQSGYAGAEAGDWGGKNGAVIGPADNTCAAMGAVGKVNLVSNFGFSLPPETTAITGVTAFVKASEGTQQIVGLQLASDATVEPPDVLGDVRDFTVPGTGNNCANTTVSSIDGGLAGWGNPALTPDIVNDPKFGLVFTKKQTSNVKVDSICMEINYTTPGGSGTQEVCFGDPPPVGTFTVNKNFSDNSTDSVDMTLICSSGSVTTNPVAATEASPAVFEITGFDAFATCTATEAATPGYTQNIGDCQAGDNFADGGSCTMVNTLQVQVESENAVFWATKEFTDGNTSEVEAAISCNTGLGQPDDGLISGVKSKGFVVTDYTPGVLNCWVRETAGPDGYITTYTAGADEGVAESVSESEDGCYFNKVVGGSFTCHIVNTPAPVTVAITKSWDINDVNGGTDVDETANITLTCDAEILGVEVDQGHWVKTFITDGDKTVTAKVIPEWEDSNCSAVETTDRMDVVVTSTCVSMSVSAGKGASCEITNTVFFEGIPTLNQYGLAIMALLMLGLGMVGFRRFV